MSVDGKIMRRARVRLDARRQEASDGLDRRTQEIYRRIPKIEQLDRQLRATMLQTVSLTMSKDPHALEAIARIREQNLDLQEERTRELVSAGYPADYLEEKPYCPRCRDTGLLPGGETCGCLKLLYREEQQKELSSLLKMGEETFDNFDLDWYSVKPDPDGIRPRELMELAYESCLQYARGFGKDHKSMLFTGGTGLGKTFLSTCIAREVSEQGFSVVYDTAVNIFSRFEQEHFGRAGDLDSIRDDLRRYMNCDLLILDDLGTEMTTSFVTSALYSLVNGRLAAGKQTIISTNLTLEDIRSRYSPQIYSRIAGEYMVLRFRGQDIRLQKKSRI